jgi:hypothetical protein
MAILFQQGFEIGAPPAAGDGTWNVVNNPSGWTFTTTAKNGARALNRAAAVGTANYLQKTLPAGNRTIGISCYYRRTANDALRDLTAIFEAYDAAGNAAGIDQLRNGGIPSSPGNELYAATWNGSTVTGVASGTGLALDTWCLVECKFDSSANPWVVTLWMDGTQVAQTTRAITAADLVTLQVGFNAAVPNDFACIYDDLVVTTGSADQPFGPHAVLDNPVRCTFNPIPLMR